MGRALISLGVGVAYYVSARLGLRVALVGHNVTPLWPPTGIALVAFLVLGVRVWPGVALGALLVNAPISSNLLAAAVTAAGNTIAPVVAAVLLERVGFRHELDRLRDAVAIVFLAALLAMGISATIGTAVLVWSGAIANEPFPPTWAVWWTGDAMGVLVVAPFLLSLLPTRTRRRGTWPRRVEAVVVFTALGLLAYAVTHTSARMLFQIGRAHV